MKKTYLFMPILLMTLLSTGVVAVSAASGCPLEIYKARTCGAPLTGLQQQTAYTWEITITVTNPNTFPVDEVTVWDRFGGEFAVATLSVSQGDVFYKYSGATEKVHLKWEIGTLAPGATATLILEVSTDLNPAGKQEFTDCGTYCMNSGAVVKWLDPQGKKGSAETPSIMLTVV